jgi:hypothetical protein
MPNLPRGAGWELTSAVFLTTSPPARLQEQTFFLPDDLSAAGQEPTFFSPVTPEKSGPCVQARRLICHRRSWTKKARFGKKLPLNGGDDAPARNVAK